MQSPIRFACVFAALALISGLSGCQRPETHTLIHQGLDRTYLVYAPVSRPAGAPLVLVLHGAGGDGWRMYHGLEFNALAERDGVVVAYPDAYRAQWNDGRDDPAMSDETRAIDDVDFLAALIDALAAEYDLDPERVYITGASNGGMMTYRFACERGARIAAMAPVIANLPVPVARDCAPVAVPAIVFNGDSDPIIPYEGGAIPGRQPHGEVLSTAASVALWQEANGCTGEPEQTLLPDVDTGDGTQVLRERFACGDAPLEVYTVLGGGHTWPGHDLIRSTRRFGHGNGDIDATALIWAFFLGQ